MKGYDEGKGSGQQPSFMSFLPSSTRALLLAPTYINYCIHREWPLISHRFSPIVGKFCPSISLPPPRSLDLDLAPLPYIILSSYACYITSQRLSRIVCQAWLPSLKFILQHVCLAISTLTTAIRRNGTFHLSPVHRPATHTRWAASIQDR